jgi:TRAP-type C4-dicarboxylate transport system permease small subunit
MRLLHSGVRGLTRITSWFAFAALILLALITVAGVTSRAVHRPILGSIELIEYTMVVLIALSFAYSQASNGHVSVGLVVDHLPRRVQLGFEAVGYLLVAATVITIAWIYLQESVLKDSSATTSTGMLAIPRLPFKIVLALGFSTWGLEALLKAVRAAVELVTPRNAVDVATEQEAGHWL